MMELIGHSLVRGERRGHELAELSVLDLLTGHINWAGIYHFKYAPDINRLRAALAGALVVFPEIAGAVVVRDGVWFIDPGAAGVLFSVYRSEKTWEELNPPGTLVDGSPLLGEDISVRRIKNTGAPVTHIRLTLCAGGECVLALRNAHTFDGPTIRNFMVCWSALYRGQAAAARSDYRRAHVDRLALGEGWKPSEKFGVAPPLNFDLGREISRHKRGFGKIAVTVPDSVVNGIIARCKQASRLPLSGSDVLHALIWQAFARSATLPDAEAGRIYSIFNLRRVRGLGIPDGFEGNAVLERHARCAFADIRALDVCELAERFHQQTKPLTAREVRRDIAFLKRERARGFINEDGRFIHFVRSSLVDCIDGSGVFVNNLSMMEPAEVYFESEALSFELMGNLGLATVFVYRNPAGDWLFHHVGKCETLESFAVMLQTIAVAYAGDNLDLSRWRDASPHKAVIHDGDRYNLVI